MEITQATIEKLLRIAALEATGEERGCFAKELEQITRWIAQLDEIDTAAVAPQVTMSVESNKFGEDVPAQALSLQRALGSAPEQDGTYFHVPAIEIRETIR